MTRRGFWVLVILALVVLLCKACIVRDVPPQKTKSDITKTKLQKVNYPEPENITLNGTDYLQSKAPVGKFGGSMVLSTVGDPKTFNPFNCKDNTSAILSWKCSG